METSSEEYVNNLRDSDQFFLLMMERHFQVLILLFIFL